ncbi:MAG: Uma2 family endonuclease, partial [Actinomycetota bacterium]|nr:Uma2 family endonuclease [Actinomycetota bacterium]
LEGEIVELSPIGSLHQGCINRLTAILVRFAAQDFVVSIQGPVRLDENSEPQPDLALLNPSPDFYANAHPTPDDVLVLIEVSETSAAYDREVKLPLYANRGIREAWIVDLESGTIEVNDEPSSEGYGRTTTKRRGEVVHSSALPELSMRAEDVLG